MDISSLNGFNSNLPFTPMSISGIQGWWATSEQVYNNAGTTPATNGQTVQQWNDISGNGRNFSQSSSTLRPTFNTNQVNGWPSISFDGVDDNLVISAAATFGFMTYLPSTTVLVVKPGNTANPNTLYGLLGSRGSSTQTIGPGVVFFQDTRNAPSFNALLVRVSTGDGQPDTAVSASDANNLFVANTYSIVMSMLDPANATASLRCSDYINNGTVQQTNVRTGTPVSTTPAYPLQLGASGNGVSPAVMNCLEVIIYNKVLSSTERTGLAVYLRNKYQIAITS